MYLFAFDVDGTLIDEKTEAHAPETMKHIQQLKAAGHRVAIITGRFFLPEDLLNLVQPDAWALGNGNQIWQGGQQVIRHQLLPEEIEALLHLLPENLSVVGSDLQEKRINYVSEHRAPEWEHWLGTLDLLPLEEGRGKPLLQMQFKGDAVPEFKARARQVLPHLNFAGGVDPYPTYLNVTAQQANKVHALKEIAALLDIPLDRTIAFGDSDNDIEMLQAAGHGVQVGTMPYLQEVCKEQVSCPLVGLPAWLEGFVRVGGLKAGV